MSVFRTLAVILCVGLLASCASKFKQYDGPQVTHILVFKQARVMALMHNTEILRRFDFELGFSPDGHKAVSGDGRTPEGSYIIDRKNPNSSFHLSIGISYPNQQDIANARALGKSPGGDIFIHGTPSLHRGTDDWTWGCIAVTNDEMEDIYAMVNVGTPIRIYP
ncbi:MAG: L,D-transpeptidase family protein [Pseudomonadota bacterium]